MNLILIITIAVIAFFSFMLALRSMKDFKDEPAKRLSYKIFLIRNPHALTKEFLTRLHLFSSRLNALVSLERLFKGGETAIVVYAPEKLAEEFPQLQLLELEDYLKQTDDNIPNAVHVNQTLGWEIEPVSKITLDQKMFNQLQVSDAMQFFWQIVLFPVKNKPDAFQASIRGMVVGPSGHERIELVKQITEEIKKRTSLLKQDRTYSSSTIFNAFAKRKIVPKEVKSFVLSEAQVLQLLGVDPI